MSPQTLVHKAFNVTKGAGSLVLLPLKLTAFVAGVGVSMAVLYLFGSGVVAYISAQDSTELAEELGQELHSFSENLLGVPLHESSIEENYQGGAFTALTAGSAQTQNIVNSGVNNQCLEIIDDAASHAAMRFAALDEHLMPDAEGGGAQEMLAASDGSAAAASPASYGSAAVTPEVMLADASQDAAPVQQSQRIQSRIEPKPIIRGHGSTPAGTQPQRLSIAQRVAANTQTFDMRFAERRQQMLAQTKPVIDPQTLEEQTQLLAGQTAKGADDTAVVAIAKTQTDAKKVGGLKERGKQIEPEQEQDTAQSALVATTKTTEREPRV